MKRHNASLAFLVCALAAQGVSQTLPGNAAAITGDRLKSHLELIADDLLEGRDTPSRGQNFAALYVATQLKLWGALPAGDNGTYFQRIEISRPTIDAEHSMVSFNGKVHKFGDGFYARGMGGDFSGELVYAGHGHVVTPKGINPYQGVDVKGKVVVVVGERPKEFEFSMLRDGRAKLPQQAAADLGAKAIITIEDMDKDAWARRVRSATSGGQAQIQGGGRNMPTIPTITVDLAFASELLAAKSVDANQLMADARANKYGESFAMDGKLTGHIESKGNDDYTQNVVAKIPGTDPSLKSEYVAIGAHIDHIGLSNSGEDRINNGADDDGSGTVSVLEIAHAFATGVKPKRSILLVWHTGEEKGLWGSNYFVENPTVPLANIITQLNLDMIGRSRPAGDTNPANKLLTGPDTIYVVGSNRISKDVGSTVSSVNSGLYNLKLDYHYDKPNDPENIYQRSDHYNYARKGIPIAFWFDGVHEDYHRVGDEVSKIDFRKMERVSRTVYAIALKLANTPERPRSNGTDIGN